MLYKNFFHPNLTGKDAENILLTKGKSGDYLVRPSETNPDNFTLSVRVDDKVVHIKIVNNGEYLSIGSNSVEGFATLSELIDFYSDPDPNAPKIKEKHGDIIELKSVLQCNDQIFQSWFHGDMNGGTAEKLLSENGRAGCFLVRRSQTKAGRLVLSVYLRTNPSTIPQCDGSAIKKAGLFTHLYINHQNGMYNIGGEPNFKELSQLIEYCQANPLVENTGAIIRLTHPVSITTMRAKYLPEYLKGKQTVIDTVDKAPMINDNAPDQSKNKKNIDKNERSAFTDEYELLRKLTVKSSALRSVGENSVNRNKNRYQNILPYDFTRVILKSTIGNFTETDDYINANYIMPLNPYATNPKLYNLPFAFDALSNDHFNNETATTNNNQKQHILQCNENIKIDENWYIATQGPLKHTIDDFWNMVWQQNVYFIIMVTKEMESGSKKCAKYWPDLGMTVKAGPYEIKNLSETFINPPSVIKSKSSLTSLTPESNNDIVRTLEVRPLNDINYAGDSFKTYNRTPRTIYHYHCKSWPDHKIPKSAIEILNLLADLHVKKDLQVKKHSIGPVVVHCSAGIGRAGCFIAIDMIYDLILKHGIEHEIDVQRTVSWIRLQRSGMVQTIQQYGFIYTALSTFITSLLQNASHHAP